MTGFALNNIQNCYVGSTPATAIYYGSSKIWPATQHDYSQDYFTIVSLVDNNNIYFGGYFYGNDSYFDNTITRSLQYSTDNGITWNTVTLATSPSGAGLSRLLHTLNTDDKLLIKGVNTEYFKEYTYESMTGYARYNWFLEMDNSKIEGNILSLIYGDNFNQYTSLPANSSYNFTAFLQTNVIDAHNLILPVNVTESCYYSLFSGDSYLVTPPELPATTLKQGCYAYMFRNCSSLNYIKCLATDISATDCTSNWLSGVSSTGSFVKDANTTWPTGTSGIPTGWTVVDAA